MYRAISIPGNHRHRHIAQRAGRYIVGMVLPPRGLFDAGAPAPAQPAEVVGQHHSAKPRRSARPASHTQRDLVMNAQVERNQLAANTRQHLAIGLEDHVVRGARAAFRIAPGGRNCQLGAGRFRRARYVQRPRLDGQRQLQCHAYRIEARPQVRAGGRQPQPDRAG